MKRLFGTIFIALTFCLVYSQAMTQKQNSPITSINYCNVGPLAAVNLGMYCLKTMQENSHNVHVLAAYAGDIERQEQLNAALEESYTETPQKLQVMKNKLCQAMGLVPDEVQLKLNTKKEAAFANTLIKLVSIGNSFLERPVEQQWGALAHELGHVKHNDGETRIHFDMASSYVAAVGTYFTTYALHIPHTLELQQPVARLAQTALGRAHERRADREAAQVPGGAQGFMEYLEVESQKYTKPAHIFDSHPPFQERIAYLKACIEQQGA